MPYIDIEARLRTALVTLILDEYSLLETVQLPLPASERVIASQLAWRLRTEYERSWDVDVEYNRVGHGSTGRSGVLGQPDPVNRPVDISIHHRGLTGRDDNLMVLELKTHGVPDLPAEVARLDKTQRHYDYQHAVLLDLGITEGSDPEGPPVVLKPGWLWLPGPRTLSPVFEGDSALQLSADGWNARKGRDAARDAARDVASNRRRSRR
ncbi:MAG: hypothetical protein LBJ62_01765 [Bifidobacteriaceae bacterium]|jgi:hypothetical protein|nr:hypothetical protein [Bifidobacteriaceae bacterium]